MSARHIHLFWLSSELSEFWSKIVFSIRSSTTWIDWFVRTIVSIQPEQVTALANRLWNIALVRLPDGWCTKVTYAKGNSFLLFTAIPLSLVLNEHVDLILFYINEFREILLWKFKGVIAAGYASKIQMEQRQLYRDSSRNNGRHYAIIWKTTQLLEPTVLTTDIKFATKFGIFILGF